MTVSVKPLRRSGGIYESDNSDGVLFREKTAASSTLDYEEVSATSLARNGWYW